MKIIEISTGKVYSVEILPVEKDEFKNLTKKGYFMIEDAEYGVDSRYKSNKERESEATALMEARLIRMKNLSKDQIIRAKLLQLKLRKNFRDIVQSRTMET